MHGGLPSFWIGKHSKADFQAASSALRGQNIQSLAVNDLDMIIVAA